MIKTIEALVTIAVIAAVLVGTYFVTKKKTPAVVTNAGGAGTGPNGESPNGPTPPPTNP